ncbi:MAG: hypothetical protein GXO00_02860 [Candidatus Diapherotrites archaeon]|nr:hypothetical protein [Candidatus Diapherotrites archaeon]
MVMEVSVEEIISLMDEIIQDTSVPRNIRSAVSDAKELVLKEEGDRVVNLTQAIYILDEASNDVNVPMHTRTQLWSLISALEAYKESLK